MLSELTMRVFAWSVFPLGFALFFALIGSKFCCEWFSRGIINVIDAILFCTCGEFQHSAVSFFWAIFIACLLVMGFSAISYFDLSDRVGGGHDCWTEQCWHHRSNELKRKFKAERNIWIAAFALTLYIAVHRLRHHIKHHLRLLKLLDESLLKMNEAGLDGPAEWLKEQLGRENRACPWRSCSTLEDDPPPSLEPDVNADEVVQLLEADAEAGPLPVLAATVVERSDVDAEVPANAADTTAAANGKESEEAKK